MVGDNAESIFKASYLPYREVVLADFTTCDAAYSVLRYAYVLFFLFFEYLRTFAKTRRVVRTASNPEYTERIAFDIHFCDRFLWIQSGGEIKKRFSISAYAAFWSSKL